MKMQPGLFVKLSEEKLTELTTEIKEVLATGLKKDNGSIFSSADLWNIQRRTGLRKTRRHV